MSSQIKLQSSDQAIFSVSGKVARQSRTIDTMLAHLKGDSEEDADFVPLSNIDAHTLKLVLEWAEEHVNDSPTVTTKPDDDEVDIDDELEAQSAKELSTWDKDYLSRLDESSLYDLITAANFLDIPQLFAMTCKEAANQLSKLTIEEIRSKHGITNDLTPEKEAQIIEENSYFEL